MDPGLILLIAVIATVSYLAGKHHNDTKARQEGYAEGYDDGSDTPAREEEEWPG